MPAAATLAYELVEPELAQIVHRSGKRADSGHDQPVRPTKRIVIAR